MEGGGVNSGNYVIAAISNMADCREAASIVSESISTYVILCGISNKQNRRIALELSMQP